MNDQGLRTDVPLMTDAELDDWINMIMRNTHYLDLMNLYEHLTKKLQDNKMRMLFDKVFKMCDKCDITYPEHITICKCGNEQLRIFKVHDKNNLEEIEKNRRVKYFCYDCSHNTDWVEYHLVAGHIICRVLN